MTANSPLTVDTRNHVAWISMNRPEKRNAMSFAMLEKMIEYVHSFENDPDVRVIVIKGEGKSFCAGMELADLAGLIQKKSADYREILRKTILYGQTSTNVIEACTKPVIAAIHSHCVGGGVDLACACDIRLASRDALFSVRETKLALVADLGTLQRFPKIVGEAWARELSLTGRDFSGEDALNIGFVTHLCEDREALYKKAEEIAGEIAENSPLAVQGVKDTMRFSSAHGVDAGLKYVAQKNASILICEDGMEALTAAMEKRKPVFKGR
ncbi:MAG: enoyl-CoA hydratase/isomerase family protein [Deltaproteobacteria bacterium]|nr:enoyl-CoA hydratase/isomerase family protein [Deltaproteobacteria bacterium]MBW2677126.1 enoyl-CoA hydratase/isomerase family protein [Deltaproteobacteria bacterium]